MKEAFLLQCLDAIEQRETPFLVWGLADISLSEDDLADLVSVLLEQSSLEIQEAYFDINKVVDDLCERMLILRISSNGTTRYRSRMAETVRLSSRLRQLFPKHKGASGWQQAPTLVADYRFVRRKRSFPARNLGTDDVLQSCQDVSCTQAQMGFLKVLLERKDFDFRLAGFQQRATSWILQGLNNRQSRGTIVCAGTGSGKTLSFYLPALTHISGLIIQHQEKNQWVKVLAIYPRNELLKDQFSEIYTEARRLDIALKGQKRRKILIGAFFGPTPWSAAVLKDTSGWKRVAGGYACEYLRCPSDGCRGRLVWSDTHVSQNKEELHCDSCNHVIYSDEVVLTRERLLKTPPDILFTTTEMLNQRMSDSRYRHLFGLGRNTVKEPSLVLLDEVHTYSGTHGAQVAYLFRRWRALVRQNVSFVGLSATLREAAGFFATLTGLNELQVKEISPKPDEMVASGAEYMLALRGDPVSRRSLLSTTIQASMLINRCLDLRGSKPSRGVFGSKTFVFTDDVDVTNRLFFNMLDAEGRDSWGKLDRKKHPDGGLASLRTAMDNHPRYLHGQDWRLCEQIGWELKNGLHIGRTCAQDAGVDLVADLVVATASLEVGFNDPEVGAVIQHKAPRDMAQFLQRKGRGGRSRTMRPWMIVSLSDYGRDRLAYQGYDLLFDPELSPRNLPINNRYIQRMQAVYALIDYLGSRMQGERSQGSVWMDLSEPMKDSTRKKILEKELITLLESSDVLDDFSQTLKRGLLIDESSLTALLWEYPRPLLTTVIPTALRRIESGWRGSEPFSRNAPLPEFAAPNLFSELNLPEVIIKLPPQPGFDTDRPPLMPVLQAMRAFAPGKVSRRFGFAHQFVRHWLVDNFDKSLELQAIELSSVAETREIGEYRYFEGDEEKLITVHRPMVFMPSVPAKEVLDTSNAQNMWQTQIVGNSSMATLETPHNSEWDLYFSRIGFFLHNHQTPVEMRRFSLGTEASIGFKDGSSLKTEFTFQVAGKAVALGFSMAVDAIVFNLTVPQDLWKDDGYISEKWRALRTSRFFDMAWRGEHLTLVESPFARDWLARVYLSSLVLETMQKNIDIKVACSQLRNEQNVIRLEQVLETIFQLSAVETEEDGESEDRLRQEIINHLRNPAVRSQLDSLAECLWNPVDDSWQPWLHRVFTATLSAAVFNAVQGLCPDLNSEDLLVDIVNNERVDEVVCDRIWISESTIGGCGLIEELIQRIGEDPRRFFNMIEVALEQSEYELIDAQLSRFLELASDEITDIFAGVRNIRVATSISDTESAYKMLSTQMKHEGFLPFHSFMVALNSRILRAGSNSEVDRMLHDVIKLWKDEELRLGIEIDARVIAYLVSNTIEVEKSLGIELGGVTTTSLPLWRFNAIYGILWPRGGVVRQTHLNLYNPFCDFPPIERLLVLDRLASPVSRLQVPCDQWQEKCLDELRQSGAVRISCGNRDKDFLKEIFNFLMTNPVEDNYLMLYPRLRSIRQEMSTVEIEVELAEAIQ